MRKITLGVICFFLIQVQGAVAYQWPVTRTAVDVYKINDSMGAYRIDHIHNGIDLGRNSGGVTNIGITVTAIEDGEFSFDTKLQNNYYEKVEITHEDPEERYFVYQHIDANFKTDH